MTQRKLANLRILLTGASSGIGRALARELARKGARLVLNARRADRLEALRGELEVSGNEVACVVGDITDPAVRSQMLTVASDRFGGVDGLINNAGIGGIGEFSENDEAKLRRITEVNYFAPLEMIRLVLPELRKGKTPFIVNVASVLGHCAVPKKSEYCASKFALHGFSDALRCELAKENIDVLLLSPSTTDSEFFDVALGDKHKLPWIHNKGQDPALVALAGVKAIERGTRETILTFGGQAMVWLDRLCPWLAHILIKKYG